MANQQALIKLGKLLSYILGHRPDEFGLIPDQEGYVKLKELLKALNEEEGLRHIRKASIDELLISLPQPPVETKDNLIRAVSRDHLPEFSTAKNPPGLLFVCVRQRAYPHILEKGLPPMEDSHVILSSHEPFAKRLGRRIDPDPVVLTIHVNSAIQRKIEFYQFGDLFMADFIPTGCFSGPPLPKEKPESKNKEAVSEPRTEYHPGSFPLALNPNHFLPKSPGPGKAKKGPDWKKDRKQIRKNKEKMWPS